jgi:ABC-type Mn2+/Zn2+ transport system permease subunit
MMAVAAASGIASVYAGLLVSYHLDLAAGASVVLVAVCGFFCTLAATACRDRWRRRSDRPAVPSGMP